MKNVVAYVRVSSQSQIENTSIETQIEGKIHNINNLTNYQEIIENKKKIDSLITKKINFDRYTRNRSCKGKGFDNPFQGYKRSKKRHPI